MVKRTLILISAVFLALALIAPAADAKSKPRLKPCKDAKLVPSKASQMKRLNLATRCLINQERIKRGLTRLKQSSELQASSDWQAQDMLSHSYFDHYRAHGPDFVARVLKYGYARDASGYEIGENIAWASSSIATPKQMVQMWMASPPHRENILTKPFRDQAVSALWSDGGVSGDYAKSGGPFVIYVNQFGRMYGPMRKR